MSPIKTLPLALSVAVILGTPLFAQKASSPPDAADQVKKVFARFSRTDTPGCAVGASIDDVLVLNAAYGMADLEHSIALTPDSVFEPGSVTKQFTAGAVLLLAQDGKLSLDDPVRKYIHDLPDYPGTITIRHLINHTSGLRDWGSITAIAGWPRGTRANTNANVLEIAARQRSLNYLPGDEFSYTNTGYNLQAILVERVSGKSLAEFTRGRMFVPLGMTSTEWRDDFQRIVHNRAIAYSQTNSRMHQDMPFENAHGNGGMLTTVGDLLRWNRNFSEMKVGGKAFVEAEQQLGHLNDGQTIGYAAGLFILHYKGLREVGHSGATAGYRGWLARYPDQRLSVAVLCNNGAANTTQLGHAVADVYLANALGKDATLPSGPPLPSSIAGLYRSIRDHGVISIEVKNGEPELDGRPLRSVSNKAFQAGPEGPTFEFEMGAAGTVDRIKIASEVEDHNYYRRIERATPTKADLATLIGEYTSDEAEVTFTVTLEQNGLVLHRRDTTIPLTPTYKDGFSSSLGSVRFLRDSGGHVRDMSIGESRVWDLRLHRVW